MEVLIFDDTGNFDMFTITNVQDDAVHVQHRGQDLNYKYDAGATITQIGELHVLSRSHDEPVDAVRRRRQGRSRSSTMWSICRSTTSAIRIRRMPKAALGVANCLYDAAGTTPICRCCRHRRFTCRADRRRCSPTGPMCGTGDNQYDADLLRVRKIRVTHARPGRDGGLRGSDTNTVHESRQRQGRRAATCRTTSVIRYFAA